MDTMTNTTAAKAAGAVLVARLMARLWGWWETSAVADPLPADLALDAAELMRVRPLPDPAWDERARWTWVTAHLHMAGVRMGEWPHVARRAA